MLIVVNFCTVSERVLAVLFYEHYLLPCVEKSTESIPLCLPCNGMNCVQSNLYRENKAESFWVTVLRFYHNQNSICSIKSLENVQHCAKV